MAQAQMRKTGGVVRHWVPGKTTARTRWKYLGRIGQHRKTMPRTRGERREPLDWVGADFVGDGDRVGGECDYDGAKQVSIGKIEESPGESDKPRRWSRLQRHDGMSRVKARHCPASRWVYKVEERRGAKVGVGSRIQTRDRLQRAPLSYEGDVAIKSRLIEVFSPTSTRRIRSTKRREEPAL